ncbi:MAG: hypothetical protein ABIJ14_00215 [Nanoarchaeota archaeon]|nr:hypothetical protein [Nanoarchaeota archaeon]
MGETTPYDIQRTREPNVKKNDYMSSKDIKDFKEIGEMLEGLAYHFRVCKEK